MKIKTTRARSETVSWRLDLVHICLLLLLAVSYWIRNQTNGCSLLKKWLNNSMQIKANVWWLENKCVLADWQHPVLEGNCVSSNFCQTITLNYAETLYSLLPSSNRTTASPSTSEKASYSIFMPRGRMVIGALLKSLCVSLAAVWRKEQAFQSRKGEGSVSRLYQRISHMPVRQWISASVLGTAEHALLYTLSVSKTHTQRHSF